MRVSVGVALLVSSLLLTACRKKNDDVGSSKIASGSGGSSTGTGGSGAGGGSGPGSGGSAGGGGTTSPSAGFALGVEYTEQGLAPPFGAIGVTWAKTRLEAFAWGASEPTAPVGGVHTYNWSCTDRLITEHQNAGMVNIQSYLSPKSPWASKSATDVMPKPENMDNYKAWITALFERYDGDGVVDMPGLKLPVRHFVVGGEWTGFWGSGNADDYIALLQATGEAGRAAYPDVKLGSIPFVMWDVFAGDEPTDAQVATRLTDPPPAWRNSAAGMMKILDRGDLFDEIDIHSLGDYTELPPQMRWLRAQMSARSYDKPVFIDDAFPIAFLVTFRATGSIVGWPSVHPASATDERAIYDVLDTVAKKTAGTYDAAKTWFDGEVAKSIVKKIVTARAEGYAGIQIGNTEDWYSDTLGGLREVTFNLIGADAMSGLIEVTHPGSADFCQMRTPGAPRPAHYNLGLVIEKLGPDLEGTVRNFSMPNLDTARVFQFVRADGRQVWVAWNEPRHLILPGQADPPVGTHVLLPNAHVRVTRVATTTPIDRASLESETTIDSVFNFNVTTVPVFVEPLP